VLLGISSLSYLLAGAPLHSSAWGCTFALGLRRITKYVSIARRSTEQKDPTTIAAMTLADIASSEGSSAKYHRGL